MINLIPIHAKKSITTEYWLRVLSVWCYVWSAALAVSICVTLPAYVLINLQVRAYDSVASLAEEEVADYSAVSKELNIASRQAVLVINDSNKHLLHQYVDLLESLRGDGLVINQISLQRTKVGVEPLTISGTASNRSTLAAFRDRLLTDANITEVDLPISNLAKDKDIQFSMTITMNNQADS
jgi:hypothetical protein